MPGTARVELRLREAALPGEAAAGAQGAAAEIDRVPAQDHHAFEQVGGDERIGGHEGGGILPAFDIQQDDLAGDPLGVIAAFFAAGEQELFVRVQKVQMRLAHLLAQMMALGLVERLDQKRHRAIR